MTGEPRMFIVNTGDVLDEVDRLTDEAIQSSRARIGWLRWIGLIGPLVGLVGAVQVFCVILHDMAYPTHWVFETGESFIPYFCKSLTCIAAGFVIAIAFLPAHHVLRSKATVLLLKARNEIKAMFPRTRPFREIGRMIPGHG